MEVRESTAGVLLQSFPNEVKVPVSGWKWDSYSPIAEEIPLRDPYNRDLSDGDMFLSIIDPESGFKNVPVRKDILLRFLDPGLDIEDSLVILKIANELGRLSYPTHHSRVDPLADNPGREVKRNSWTVDTYNYWKQEISSVRFTGQLLEAISNGDISYLKEVIHIFPNQVRVDFPNFPGWRFKFAGFSPVTDEADWHLLEENKFDLIFTAKLFLLRTINLFLEQNSAFHQFEFLDNDAIIPSAKQLSLSATIWFQLGEWLAESSLYRRCPHCEELLRTSSWQGKPVHNRETGHYIHDYCYQAWIKNHQRKKERLKKQKEHANMTNNEV